MASSAYQIPLQMPPGLGGPTPDVTLRYSSGLVDGRTLSTNAQASWVGEGWDYTPGYIEQAYRNCKDDGATNTDLCWFSDKVFTMVFGGHSTRLVKDDATGLWHGEADDGSRIELLTDTTLGNGDRMGRYFKLTTLDGTQYFFGRTKRFAGDVSANSGQSVLVFGNNVGEPCHNATHDYWSGCEMNLRWYLDYVVDPRGNSMTYFYSKYGASYGDWNATDVWDYDLTVTLDHIDYGTRAGSEGAGPAPMQVVFATGVRCIASVCADHPENWPDTPWDQFCHLGHHLLAPHADVLDPVPASDGHHLGEEPRRRLSERGPVGADPVVPVHPGRLPVLAVVRLVRAHRLHRRRLGGGTVDAFRWGRVRQPGPGQRYDLSACAAGLDRQRGGRGTTVAYAPAECTEANIVGVQ